MRFSFLLLFFVLLFSFSKKNSNFFIDTHPFHLVLRKRICRENKFTTRNHRIRERENERVRSRQARIRRELDACRYAACWLELADWLALCVRGIKQGHFCQCLCIFMCYWLAINIIFFVFFVSSMPTAMPWYVLPPSPSIFCRQTLPPRDCAPSSSWWPFCVPRKPLAWLDRQGGLTVWGVWLWGPAYLFSLGRLGDLWGQLVCATFQSKWLILFLSLPSSLWQRTMWKENVTLILWLTVLYINDFFTAANLYMNG